MGRSRTALILLAAAIALWWHMTPTSAQPSCQFVGDFAVLRELVGPETVGDCLEDEHIGADDGGTEQRTTGGILMRRDTDNVMVFTDGVTSWVNGPNGLQTRPNGERFGWESDPDRPPTTPPSSDDVSADPPLLPNIPSLFGVAPAQDTAPGATVAAAPEAPTSPPSASAPTATATRGTSATPTRTAAPGPTSTPTVPPAGGQTSPVDGQCPATHRIKGATSSKGEKLFYEPERPEYAKVRPDMCFTAGGDARDAGYVSAKR